MNDKTQMRLFLLLVLSATMGACNVIESDAPPNFVSLRESRPVNQTKELEVRLKYDVGSLEVARNGGEDLFSLDLEYDDRRSVPRFDFREGERASLDLQVEPRNHINSGKQNNDLTLKLKDNIPLELDIATGVSDGHLDLTSLDIRRFHLRGGVGKTEVTFDKPAEQPLRNFDVESGVGSLTIRGLGNARVERLDVKGGVGRTELDFTGESNSARMESEISVGVGAIRLLLPRDAGIEIQADGGFLSNISAPSFDKEGRMYIHRASDGAATRIFIRVRSGVGGVTVELI
jgi:hypothetical protein